MSSLLELSVFPRREATDFHEGHLGRIATMRRAVRMVTRPVFSGRVRSIVLEWSYQMRDPTALHLADDLRFP
jgi:hypothetical protein